jgi:hypothetical protein
MAGLHTLIEGVVAVAGHHVASARDIAKLGMRYERAQVRDAFVFDDIALQAANEQHRDLHARRDRRKPLTEFRRLD